MAKNRLTIDEIIVAREIHQVISVLGNVQSQSVAIPHNVWRFNGQVKRWKRNPARYYVGIKFGMYEYGSLDSETGTSLYGWLYTDQTCPICSEYRDENGFGLGTAKLIRDKDGGLKVVR